jgi:glycopeptide antibiotics resistance protein
LAVIDIALSENPGRAIQQMISNQHMQLTTSSQQRATSTKRRATSIKFLFWLYVVFVIYGITMPLRPDLTSSGMRHRWKRTERIPFLNSEGGRLSLGDAVGNILLFVPFGFFLHSWRQARRPETVGFSREPIGGSPTLLAAFVFSSAIECGQLFLDGRVTSVNDVINNLVGAFIGIRRAAAHPGLVANTWEALKRMARLRPFLALWLATMAVQTLIALAPFDFTLKKENFQRQWLRWQYSWQELRSAGQIHPGTGSWLQNFPHHGHLLASLFSTLGCAVLLGALAIICCQRHGPRSLRICRTTIAATLFFYPALTILQFTVQSIRPYVLFPVTGLGGVSIGMLLMGAFSLSVKNMGKNS